MLRSLSGGQQIDTYPPPPDISVAPEDTEFHYRLPDYEMAAILFKNAQAVKGLPWFIQSTYRTLELNHTGHLSYAMDFLRFSNVNLTMEVLGANKVSSRYKFRDFQGTAMVPAGWQALLETRCQDDQDHGASQGLNLTLYESLATIPQGGISHTWISNEANFFVPKIGGKTSRNATTTICKSSMLCDLMVGN